MRTSFSGTHTGQYGAPAFVPKDVLLSGKAPVLPNMKDAYLDMYPDIKDEYRAIYEAAKASDVEGDEGDSSSPAVNTNFMTGLNDYVRAKVSHLPAEEQKRIEAHRQQIKASRVAAKNPTVMPATTEDLKVRSQRYAR